jgi:hypothetical protein
MRYSIRVGYLAITRSSAVSILTVLILLFSPVAVWAAKGPCDVTVSTSLSNTIRCDSGACLGRVHIVPEQKECADVDETSCTSVPINLVVEYEAKSVSYTAAEIAVNLGVGVVCASCVIGIVAATGATGGVAVPLITIACGSACAVAFALIDECWFVRCEMDISTRTITPGGNRC